MWCVAELNEEYIKKMEDVLEIYEKPYDPAEPVVCVDEKPVTLHADVRPASPAQPGQEARRDNEYERRGTANVFCAVEPKAGRHFTFATPDRSAFEFARVACELALHYRNADTLYIWSWITSTFTVSNHSQTSSEWRWAAMSGAASQSTSPRNTEAGSTRQKSRSASFRQTTNPRSDLTSPGEPGMEPSNES